MAGQSSDFQNVLDTLPLGILISSQPEGVISYLNEKASELLQIPAESAFGLRGLDFLVEEEKRNEIAKKLMEEGGSVSLRALCRTMSGREFMATLYASQVIFGASPCTVVVLAEVQQV